MTIANETVALFNGIAARIHLPAVQGIHLFPRVTDDEKLDDFGFVFLEDGSAGPFYTGFPETLEYLWQRFPDGRTCDIETLELIRMFSEDSLPMRALALGAINATSQHLMRRASYNPAEKNSHPVNSTGIGQPQPGERVGMVGYFPRLVEKLLQQNIEILVIEKNPERVEPLPGITPGQDATDLAQCAHVICTASTLINQTLDEILQHSRNAKTFSLVGPSGSGLPDVLFKHGVDAVGGVFFHDITALQKALAEEESWGQSGNKYQITANCYPGSELLLQNFLTKYKVSVKKQEKA